jgi:hypothetical protein
MYNGDRDTLLASLNRIQKTAAGILADLRGSNGAGGEFGAPLAISVPRAAA